MIKTILSQLTKDRFALKAGAMILVPVLVVAALATVPISVFIYALVVGIITAIFISLLA